MFKENLKKLRKQKGMSQEVLAQQLKVVRQTISKWEKGYSVPDAQMLIQLADVFEVTVSDLLGSEVKTETNQNEIAIQLAVLNEQLANQRRWQMNALKAAGIAVAFIVVILFFTAFSKLSYIKINATPPLSKTSISYSMVLYGDDTDVWYDGDEFITEKVVDPYIQQFGKHYNGSLFPVIYEFLYNSAYTIDIDVKGYLGDYNMNGYIGNMTTEYN